jgi:alkylhydroperoxidase/carboxymuconolactone decarboxylase family protein YurZ
MNALPKPPETFTAFVKRYPELGEAWEMIAKGGRSGPLDEPTARLIKLGVAIGALREGAVHASVRKALSVGVEPAALEQVVALAAGTVGLPGAVAAYSWVRETLPDQAGR